MITISPNRSNGDKNPWPHLIIIHRQYWYKERNKWRKKRNLTVFSHKNHHLDLCKNDELKTELNGHIVAVKTATWEREIKTHTTQTVKLLSGEGVLIALSK